MYDDTGGRFNGRGRRNLKSVRKEAFFLPKRQLHFTDKHSVICQEN